MLLEIPQPDLPDSAPDWAWWVQLLCWLIVTVFTLWVGQRQVRSQLRENREALASMAADVSATKEQAVNAHEGAEYPNLREELTVFRTDTQTALASIRDDVGGLHSEVRDVRGDVGRVRNDVTGIRDDARRDRRKLSSQEQALDEHLAEVPRILEEAFERHASDCPVRQPPK